MSKINISVPDEVLDEIDRRARSAGTTRSGFLRDAAAHYMTALDEKAAAEERSKRVLTALDKMRSLAPSVGAPGSGTVIRELRDAAPRWDKT
jgi:metal-responsive CopG/Arc/MetJ family transcriptional regulator